MMKPFLCSLLLLVAVDAVAAQTSCDEVGTYNVVVDGVSQPFCVTVTPCQGALDDPSNPSRTACPGPTDADVTGVRSLSIGSCCASVSDSNTAVGCVSLDLINDTRQCLAPPSIDIRARRLRWLQSTKAQESQSLLAPAPIEAVDQSDLSIATTSSNSGDGSPEDGEAITFPPSPSTNQPSDTSGDGVNESTDTPTTPAPSTNQPSDTSGDGAIDSSSPAPTDSTPYPTDSTPSPDAEWDDHSTTTTPAPSTNQPSDTSGDGVGDVTYLPPSAGSEWDDSNTSTTPTPVSTTNQPSDTSGDGVNELTPVVSPVPIDSSPAPTTSITTTSSPSPTTPSPQDLWESIIQSILTSTPRPSTSQSSDSSGDGIYGWDNKPTPVPIDATPSPNDWTQSSSFGSRDGSSWSGHSSSSASGSGHHVLGAGAEPEAGDPTGLMKPVTVPAPAPTSTQMNDLETLTPITTSPTENNKQDSYSSDQGGMSSTGTNSFSSKTNTNALFLSIIGVIAVMAVAIGALLLRRRSGKPGQTSVAGTSVLTPRDDEDAMFSPIRVQSAASYRLSSTPGNDRPTRPSFYL